MSGEVPNKELNYDISDQSSSTRDLRDILDQLEQDISLLNNPSNIQRIMSLLQVGANPNVQNQAGKTLLDYLNKKLSDILESNGDPLSNIQHIILLLEAGADPNTKGQDGKTLLDYLNKKLSDILESNGDPLSNIQHIILLLEAGANPNVQNQDGKTLSYYLNKKLLGILDELEQNIVALSDHGYIQHIIGLLQVGADPNTKGQDGKTLLDYLNEELLNILNRLAIDSNLLDNSNNTQYIMSLLQAGANPNVQNQAGKTLLHYVAERNDINGIRYFLGVIKANPSIRDQSGKTPFEYVTEPNCLQALRGLGYISNDKTTYTELSNSEEDSDYHSDGSCENEENPANNSSNYPNKHNDDQTLRDDPGYGFSDDTSDYDRRDEDSSCSSSDYLFLEDSLLAKLEIPLTTDEQKLIDKFCEEIRGITAQNKQESEESILKSIEKIVDEYLEEGIRLNSSCSNDNDNGDKETVTSFIFKEMEGVIAQLRVNPRSSTAMLNTHDYTDESDGDEYKADEYETSDTIIKKITSNLLLKGGMGKKFLSGNTELTNKHYDFGYLDGLNKEYKNRKEELKSIACEGIVNKSKQTHEYDFKAEIDNVYFYVKYPQDSIIEPAKVLNHEKAKKLNLKVGILQIGESIVRVESIDGKRNYKDILKGSIKMSFTTEVGEISIYLSPSKKDGNKIKIEIDEENKAKFNKLKDKSSLGKNCLLEGENVSEVISKNFKMSDSVSTEPTETIKDVPFTDFTQAYLQQINTRAKG